MANRVTETTIKSSEFVSSLSRYAEAPVIYYGDRNKMTFKTYKRGSIDPKPGDRFTVVNAGTEYRPDLVSYKAYGVPDFWWRIMEANGVKDIFEFKSGLNIRIPEAIF